MTFLNPFVLIGLAAAALPVIIHLLNLRKLRNVDFSSIRFLKELQKTRMRRLRIRQILLLVLRTLLIITLVLAFSRPALHGSLAGIGGAQASTTMIILLDDSPSMAVRNDQGVLFNQAREAAVRILRLAKEGDRIFVASLADVRHAEVLSPVRSVEVASASLGARQLSQETLPFKPALRRAASMFASSPNANEELYLLTDAQATQFTSSPAETDSGVTFEARAKVFLVAFASSRRDNAAITAVDRKTQIVTQNSPVTIRATVRNFGQAAIHNLTLSVYLDGARAAQQSLEITPGGATAADITIVPRRRGTLEGYAQIEDDVLAIDNQRYFVLNVPALINVLLVGSSPADTKYAALALAPGSDSTVTRLFSVRQVTEAQLPSTDFNSYDVLMLAGVRDLSPVEADRVTQFVRGGGGLAIFPGDASDLANYNATILPKLDIPPVSGPLESHEGGTFVTFERVDFVHPLFAGLFDQPFGKKSTAPVIESPKVLKFISVSPGANGRAIITLSNGKSFLTEYAVGAGRVLLYSVGAGPTWSDFPLKGLFAPLIHRSAMYLGSQDESGEEFTAGDKLLFRAKLKNMADRDMFVLRSPSGVDERVLPKSVTAAGTATFEASPATEVGIYGLYRVDAVTPVSKGGHTDPLRAVAVNVSPSESDLRPADDDALNTFRSTLGLASGQMQKVTDPGSIETIVRESRFGIELWKYLLGFAIVLALAEMALGREARPQPTEGDGGGS